MSSEPSSTETSPIRQGARLDLGSSGLRLHRVEQGEVDFFLLFGDRGSDRPREFLWFQPQGSLVFDTGFQKLPEDLEIVAVPRGQSRISQVSPDLSPSDLVEPLENWIRQCVEAILRIGQQDRPATTQVLPGPIPPLAESEVLGIRQGLFWWERSSGVVDYLGVTSEGGILPIITRAGAIARSPIPKSRLLTTQEFLERPDRWERLADIHAILAQALYLARLERKKREQAQVAERERLGASLYDVAWKEIAQVIRPTEIEPAASLGIVASSVESAFHRVASAMGVTGVTLPSTKGKTLSEAVSELARASSLRWRQVLTVGNWYSRNSGALIGSLEKSGEAVALIPSGARRYFMIRADGQRERVTSKVAAELSPISFCLYRTLPGRKLRLRDVFQFATKGNFPDIGTIFAMVVIAGLLSLATPALSAHIYDVIIPQAERGMMLQITVILLSAAFANCIFELIRAIALIRVENRTDSQLEAAIWDRLLKLPTNFFREYTAGDLASRAQGISEAHQVLSSAGVAVLFTLPVGLFNLIVMFRYSGELAFWGLGLAIAGALIVVAFNLSELLFLRHQYAIRGKLAGLVFQVINGIGKIRMANAESFAFANWSRDYAAQERLSLKVGKIGVGAQTFYSGFSLLTTAIIFGLVGWQLEKATNGGHQLSTGQFLAFNSAFGALIGSLVSVAQNSLSLLKLLPLLERTKPIFEAEPEVSLHRTSPGELVGGIEFANLTFSYRSDLPPVLNGLSLKIEPGKMVAIVGPSGCGKSTLLRLLLGFETPASGSIFYDGKDLQTLDLLEVRRQIGVVLQNSRLIAGDIFRNIVGESNLTIEDAWKAAEMAGLAEDIRAMPMQMFTMISEGGGGFSGGQKQRLAIARAFAHGPRLLFFDEATSALDNRTQAIVTASMQNFQVTRLVVAHRLSTIMGADRIIMLNEGRIVEEGTYEELMARQGAFYELAKRQIA